MVNADTTIPERYIIQRVITRSTVKQISMFAYLLTNIDLAWIEALQDIKAVIEQNFIVYMYETVRELEMEKK